MRRKGGWPEGKKQKPPRDISAPHTPTTGYVYGADEDKQRYNRELQASQCSQASRAFPGRQTVHEAQAL
ncbi:hypothetical protein PRBEI_2000477600 [Prionailurus iriomotensis]